VIDPESQAPPVAEEVHLPGPTIKPLIAAIAITLIVIGTTITWLLSILGGIVLIWVVVKWIGDTRRDIDALPEDHGAH
jgi:hypothetical protein